MINREIGREKASAFLLAHEQDNLQEESSKKMDLHNNKKGQEVAERLIRNGNYDENYLLKEFERNLEDNHLIVLKRRK